MARSTELKAKKNDQPAEVDEPSWQKDSVDRSLRNARARAQARSDRFVSAAIELLGERDESDFTIQDVVDKSNMSQRTFYTFFDGKDSLLLATLHSAVLSGGQSTSADHLWAFCSAAILRTAT